MGPGRRPTRLVRSYYDEIYVFVYRQTGCKEDALDLTQGIFMAALRSLPSYDRRKASFRTWLYRIAANKVVDARRRARARMAPLEARGRACSGRLFGRGARKMLLEQIEAYVSTLDPQVQAVFRLHLYGEKPFPEIAEILGQTESAVKSQYYRLRDRLRKEFGPYE